MHAHLREYPVSELPEDPDELLRWIYDRWKEKDELVDTFRRTGSFGYPTLPVTIPEERFRGLIVWKIAVAVVTVAGLYKFAF